MGCLRCNDDYWRTNFPRAFALKRCRREGWLPYRARLPGGQDASAQGQHDLRSGLSMAVYLFVISNWTAAWCVYSLLSIYPPIYLNFNSLNKHLQSIQIKMWKMLDPMQIPGPSPWSTDSDLPTLSVNLLSNYYTYSNVITWILHKYILCAFLVLEEHTESWWSCGEAFSEHVEKVGYWLLPRDPAGNGHSRPCVWSLGHLSPSKCQWKTKPRGDGALEATGVVSGALEKANKAVAPWWWTWRHESWAVGQSKWLSQAGEENDRHHRIAEGSAPNIQVKLPWGRHRQYGRGDTSK